MAFCVRNRDGDLIFAKTRILKDLSVIVSKIKAIKVGLNYCIQYSLFPIIIETNSLTAQKVLNRI